MVLTVFFKEVLNRWLSRLCANDQKKRRLWERQWKGRKCAERYRCWINANYVHSLPAHGPWDSLAQSFSRI